VASESDGPVLLGEILDVVLSRLSRGARVGICGAISQYNSLEGIQGPRNYLSLLVNRARMEGFLVFDYAARYAEGVQAIARWMAEGRVRGALPAWGRRPARGSPRSSAPGAGG